MELREEEAGAEEERRVGGGGRRAVTHTCSSAVRYCATLQCIVPVGVTWPCDTSEINAVKHDRFLVGSFDCGGAAFTQATTNRRVPDSTHVRQARVASHELVSYLVHQAKTASRRSDQSRGGGGVSAMYCTCMNVWSVVIFDTTSFKVCTPLPPISIPSSLPDLRAAHVRRIRDGAISCGGPFHLVVSSTKA